jgi:hypothetical protein
MAKNGKMVILRGTSDPSGANKFPNEFGKPAKWPIGALHVQAAEDFARKRGYEPKTLGLEGQQSVYKGKQVREFLKLFAGLILGRKWYENDMELKPDLDIHAIYGFSGGAYNVFWILNFLAENQPNGRTVGKPSTIPILIGASCRQRCPRSRTRHERRRAASFRASIPPLSARPTRRVV